MGAGKLVVYVEDNSANFALVCKLLETTGNYEVLRAADGEAGLALIRARRPDLVLLDLDLPGISGIEVTRLLKGDPATAMIPILVITASVMKREHSSALEAGANLFLEKPFEIMQLRALVDQACGLPPSDASGSA